MAFDPVADYPVGSTRPELLTTSTGRPFAELTFAAAQAGVVDSGELRPTAAALRLQAEVARAAGRVQLADNLDRAAELVDVPDDELLAVYTALRPGRSTAAELEAVAVGLAARGADACAAFVREAAAVYVERGLVTRV